ncbi:MAG TPA: hypothetical protein VKL22_04370 [Actinomycetota bacterium]|nr:hypothetical protein [Actinomycetota bacterium]
MRPARTKMAAMTSALGAAVLALGACSSGNDNPAIGGGGSVGQISEVTMQALNGGQAGTATLTESPDLMLTVTVKLQKTPGAQEPAGVHAGTCGGIDPATKFPLSSVIDGQSTTTSVKTTLGELSSRPYVIVVQRSGTDSTPVSCGAIPQASASP